MAFGKLSMDSGKQTMNIIKLAIGNGKPKMDIGKATIGNAELSTTDALGPKLEQHTQIP